jgi:hypothetical protein
VSQSGSQALDYSSVACYDIFLVHFSFAICVGVSLRLNGAVVHERIRRVPKKFLQYCSRPLILFAFMYFARDVVVVLITCESQLLPECLS